VSKNDPARTRPAHQGRSDQIDPDPPAAADPAVEQLPDAGDEVLLEREGPVLAAEPAQGETERLRAELEQARDRLLRAQAEMENYRKRVARDIQEERRYANLPLIRDLLPVWDNVGRAIEAAEKTHETASLLEGFKMVAEQLQSVLGRHHCVRIDALEQPFDPNLHEAISQQPSDAHPANTVLTVAQTGFRLHDRVVRPSQVVVSAAVSKEQETEGDKTSPSGSDEGIQSDAHL
jgi:molecular chaperone GrpE